MVNLKPGDDIVSIVDAHSANTTYVFAAGVYRLTEIINPHDGDKFVGPCGSPPCGNGVSAILNGSQVMAPVFNSTYHYWSVGGRTQTVPKAISVSYTHLDVYKRQQQYGADSEREFDDQWDAAAVDRWRFE